MAIYPPTWVRAQIEEPYFSAPTSSVALVSNLGIVKEPRISGVDKASASPVDAQENVGTTTARQLVVSAFPDAPIMVRIAQAESHMIPNAKNPRSTATGLFQVLSGTARAYGCGDQTIAEESIKCARKIYDAEGTIPWLSSKTNW